jgi:two-component system response regulator
MNHQLEEVNLDSIISFVRHELKTPINAILGYGEILQEELEECGCSWYQQLEKITHNGRGILDIINDSFLVSSTPEQSYPDFSELGQEVANKSNQLIAEIIAITGQLSLDVEEEQSKEDITKIHDSALRLQSLVNDINKIVQHYLESQSLDVVSPEPQIEAPFELSSEPETIEASIAKILVVDDTQTNLDLLSRQLIRKGHQVTVCLSAKLALEKLKVEEYDLILLDLIMPEMNGYQLLEYLKGNPQFRHIPVIMISALDDFSSVISCIEIGAEDFLPKPFDPVLLKARIDSSLERKRLRDKEKLYTLQVEKLSQMMQKELDKGRQMQKNFLPSRLLVKPGWEFDAFFSPARQLAGDFYDCFELSDNCVGIVVADVCDKGVGAALFMGLFRSLIRIFSGQTSLEGLNSQSPSHQTSSDMALDKMPLQPLDAVRLVNNYVAINHGDTGMFATLFFGTLDLESGVLNYISGGHEPAFVLDRDHQICQTLKSTGPAVGMLPDLPFKIQQTVLNPEETLVIYTDGVPEAKSVTGEFFKPERLMTVLEKPQPSAKATLDYITQQVLEHIGEAEQFDDITLLVTRRS